MSSKLWRQLVDRLSNQATRRGGVAIEDPGMLTLQPPQDSGELVRATLYTDESGTDRTVIVTTGFAHRLTATLQGRDDVQDVCMMVVARRGGRAADVG